MLKRGTKDWKRFWNKVQKGSGCWEWQAYYNPNGYGTFWLKDRKHQAHRVSYAMSYDIPEGLCVLHTCDNPPCVRPSHLFLGTQADNMTDMVNKGRRRPARGIRSGRAKLTETQVKAIRCDPRSQRVMAKDYRVSHGVIGRIKQRKTWKHVI
ncbi:hypothetical protein LCGC14_0208180 [marine sediment metagenome]|uniref:HNH nuclease domain-containing protein n=1 Tax=marine sediment metagenome TaxID=412755 RepID=A0A0F9UXV5_9ZZZZ